MKKIFGSFRSINPRTLAVFVPVSLAYPIIRGLFSKGDPLTLISDALFIMSLVLILIGVVFTLYINGDFDITSFVAGRSVGKNKKEYTEFKKDRAAERSRAFNYPLFLGLIYLAASVFIAYVLVK